MTTMKKIYQIPTTDVMNVELQLMIADSFGEQGGSGQVNGGVSTSDGLSRGHGSVWDDDEE